MPPIQPDQVLSTVAFHDRLNPLLWTDGAMRPEVRVRLLRIALKFYQFLEIPGLKVEDIVVTGSNAAFNYTRLSDIDIHLVVDYRTAVCPDTAENLFTAKKNLWNSEHELSIRGFGVELYVEDANRPAESNGVYSILRAEWRSQPSSKEPRFDDAALVRKTEALAGQIDGLLRRPDDAQLDRMLKRLKAMRQAGLESGGEFSVENLTFKSLRALGYVDRLRAARTEAEDDALSLAD